jgi:hypothetical protein
MVFNWNSNLETKESFISENPSAKTKDISEKFDVSYGLVSKIRNNKLGKPGRQKQSNSNFCNSFFFKKKTI